MFLQYNHGMNVLIYQVYVGRPTKLYDFCTDSVARYCARYGISHIVQREPILKIKPSANSGRSKEAVSRLGYLPIYEKENAFDLLQDFTQVAIIDSDIYIKGDAPNIFEELGVEYDFGAVAEREMPVTPPSTPRRSKRTPRGSMHR